MFLVWLTVYVLCGCGVAFFIHKDGEFRPIDTSGYMIGSVFIWPFIFPIWILTRPPSNIKDMTFEKSTAHFKQWSRNHKPRAIGDFSHWDKKSEEGEEDHLDYDDGISGQTSPDKPYVIGENTIPIDENSPYNPQYDDSNGSSPRKVYNPFKNKPQPSFRSSGVDSNMTGKKSTDNGKVNLPSIADIIDDSHLKAKKAAPTGKAFTDHNVRKLIDDGKLRDAYRVARRMLKVSNELGEENRSKAYNRYLTEIENRMKAEKEGGG
ncbi:hypothetical protein J7L05_12365 [bacterium]|nr:hypothetical protein [bacterium]